MSLDPAEPPPPTWFDPPDVNVGRHGHHAAAGRLAQRRSAEAETIARLMPAVAARYQALMTAVPDDGCRAELQDLLIEGLLLKPGLLDALETLAAQPLAEGLERDRLLTELMREVAEPAAINQRLHATCGAAAAQMLLARQDPGEYARLVAGLAGPDGRAKTRGGAVLQREPGTEEPGKVRKGEGGPWAKDGRSEPSRLFQSAGMELANGFADYDPTADRHTDLRGYGLSQGLPQEGVSMLVSALLGRPVQTIRATGDKAAAMAQVDAVAATGQGVPVGLAWNQEDEAGRVHAYHELVVIAMDAERVYYMNPWGRQESMARADFQARLEAASLVAPASWRHRLSAIGAWAFAAFILLVLGLGLTGLFGR